MNPLLEYALRATLVFAFAFATTRLLRRQPAAVRHLIWTCAFGVAAAIPLLTQLGPRIEIQRPAPVVIAHAQPIAASVDDLPLQSLPPLKRPKSRSTEIPLLEILWIAGMLPFGIRMWNAIRKTRALLTNVTVLENVSEVGSQIQVGETDAVSTAITLGVFRPWILLPTEHRQWEPELLRAVMQHELAHVRRRDCLVQWLPNLVCAVNWFNPLAWLARSEMLCESERACDDAVIRSGVSGSAFARDLVEIARTIQSKGDSLMSTALTTKLEQRIRRLVDPSAKRRPLTAGRAAFGAGIALALLIPIAGVRAEQTLQPSPLPPAPKIPAPEAPRMAAQATPAKTAPVQIAQATPTPAPQPMPTGSISGVVRDPSDAVIAGAKVQLQLSDPLNQRVLTFSAVADPVGRWSFSNLPDGTYTVGVTVPGFAIFSKMVTVAQGSNTTMFCNLTLGRISESVTIAAARSTPAAAPTSPPPQRPIKVGGNVQAPKLIRHPSPVFPQIARDQGIQGTVTFEAIITKTGSVSDARLVPSNAPPELIEAARDQIQQWQYSPALLNGEPVEVITEITVNFTLQ